MDIGPDPEAEANGDPGNRRGILLLRRLRSGDGGGGGELAAVLASPTRSRPSASESAIRPGVGGGVVMFGARIQSESARLRCTYSTIWHTGANPFYCTAVQISIRFVIVMYTYL